tara:strand:+ start:636 stop:923 length:288 start_codon:yes stop_codon:yes gene_type:complete
VDWILLAQGPEAEAAGAAVAVGVIVFYFLCMGISILLGIVSTAFWIWMLVDCCTNEPSEGNDKVVWILLIVFLGVIGAIVYYFARRQPRLSRYGK